MRLSRSLLLFSGLVACGPSGMVTNETTGAGTTGAVTTCVPGASAACTCTDGQAGAQTCNADGSFELCVCEAGTTGVATGTTGNAATTGAASMGHGATTSGVAASTGTPGSSAAATSGSGSTGTATSTGAASTSSSSGGTTLLAPTCPFAVGVSSTEIDVSWTEQIFSLPATGYVVYRDGTQIGTATATSFQDKGLAAGATHSYTVTATAGGQTSAQSSAASGTTLTQATPTPLTACGNLTQANGSYILQNDVDSIATCFAILADGITLNLNGHTVTYDDSTPIDVANGDFEQGSGTTATSWDFSQATNASWITGTFVNPVEVHSGTHSVQFTLPSADQTVVASAPVTGLKPNTLYTLSAMAFDTGGDAVSVFVGFQGTSIQATTVDPAYRGFQYFSVQFTTPATVPSYTINFGITGASGAAASTIYVDDVSVQRYGSNGIAVGPPSWESNDFPDLTQFGSGNDVVVLNGSVKEGGGNGEMAHGINVGANNVSVTLYDVAVDVHGENARNIIAQDPVNELYAVNDTLTSEVSVITDRDSFDGSVIQLNGGGAGGKFFRNSIQGGPQNGIQPSSDNAAQPHEICGNSIALTSVYTNDFAIQLWADQASLVHDNVIDCTGANDSCRGIYVGGNANQTQIYDNSIKVQELPRQQEYDGCEGGGAYGIQFDNTPTNALATHNQVLAISDQCDGEGLRTTDSETATNLSQANNYAAQHLSSTSVGKAVAWGLDSPTAFTSQGDSFSGDTADVYVDWDGASNITCESGSFSPGPSADSTYVTFSFWNGGTPAAALHYVDSVFSGQASATSTDMVPIGSTGASDNAEYFIDWTFTLTVQDQNGNALAGATVDITDALGTQVFSGSTDASGQIVSPLTEFRMYNTSSAVTKEAHTPHTVTVTKSGCTASPSSFPVSVDQTTSQTTTLTCS